MDGFFGNSYEHNRIVSALKHVIMGGNEDVVDDDDEPTQSEHPELPAVVQGASLFASPPSAFTGSMEPTRRQQQQQKVKKKKKMKSGKKYRGVRQRSNSQGNKWVAEIWDPSRSKCQWLGTFDSGEEAARAYDRKAIELGAFSSLNFPLEDYPHDELRNHQLGVGPSNPNPNPNPDPDPDEPSFEVLAGPPDLTNINSNTETVDDTEDFDFGQFEDLNVEELMKILDSKP